MPFNPDTSKNKLPTFADSAEESAFDSTIIDNTSTLKNTGFKPNTTIKSSEMNTYIRMMASALNGIADSFGSAEAHELKADSDGQEWGNYLISGLKKMFESNYAGYAKKLVKSTSTPDAIEKLNVGSDSSPIYFEEGQPTACRYGFTVVGTVDQSSSDYDAIKVFDVDLSNFKSSLCFIRISIGNRDAFSGLVMIDEKGLISGSYEQPYRFNFDGIPAYARLLSNDSLGKPVCYFYTLAIVDNKIKKLLHVDVKSMTAAMSIMKVLSI